MRPLKDTLGWWLALALLLVALRAARGPLWLAPTIVFLLMLLWGPLRTIFARGVATAATARRLAALADREAALQDEAGCSPENPIVVETPAVVDQRARARPCPLCGGALRFEEQTAERHEGRLLRCTHLTCIDCGVPRRFWFRIGAPTMN